MPTVPAMDGLVVEAARRVGDHWRHQYDSLTLFTANKYNRLPVLGFPGRRWGFATKEEVATALESYAERFDLPVAGVYFCGLAFQSSMASMNFFGVGRDAAYVADRIAGHVADRNGAGTSAQVAATRRVSVPSTTP